MQVEPLVSLLVKLNPFDQLIDSCTEGINISLGEIWDRTGRIIIEGFLGLVATIAIREALILHDLCLQSGHPEVRYLELSMETLQDVLRLDVQVNDPTRMQLIQPQTHISHYSFNVFFWEWLVIVKSPSVGVLPEGHIAEFHL